MIKILKYSNINTEEVVRLPLSKSIANRLLIARALSNNSFEISSLPKAKDSLILERVLRTSEEKVNVGMAGTAYRFLTAYYAIQNGEKILEGAARMKERPIAILVDQLRQLGAEIEYLENDGYPPLRIKGKSLISKQLSLDSSVSSQFVSALLLIAPYLENGLSIELQSKLVSLPYIDLSINLMQVLGIKATRKHNHIDVSPGEYRSEQDVDVEVDWSSAAFIYQIALFSAQPIRIKGLIKDSLQGDKKCMHYFERLGVHTSFDNEIVTLSIEEKEMPSLLEFDMLDCPDLIPSIAVSAVHYARKTLIHGVSTLRYKESNRVLALRTELAKINVQLKEIGEDTIELIKLNEDAPISSNICFDTYNDHRIAMCLAPLAIRYKNISIKDPLVVDKSFPSYWEQLEKLGIK